MAKDPQLTTTAALALQAWCRQVRETCELAEQPGRADEFIRSGMPLGQVCAMLAEAQAVGLRSHEPITALRLAGVDDGEASAEPLPVALHAPAADTVAALRYAAAVGQLCDLAGMPAGAADYIEAATPIRAVRHELLEAKAAASAENQLSNLHQPGVASPATLPNAARIYRARAIAMGQAPSP